VKRSCVIICPLGLSPPVVTEFLDYTINIFNYRVLDIYLIATREEKVIESVKVVEAAIKHKYPNVKVTVDYLNYTDVDSDETQIDFMRLVLRRLKWFSNRYGKVDILVNVAGGRKTMVLLTTLVATLVGTPYVYHIIASDIKAFNEALERVRSDISEIARIDSLEGRVEEYRKRLDKLDPVMYPPRDSYKVIQIPIIPYPIDYIGKLMKIITTRKPIEVEESGLDDTTLNMLSKVNIVKIYSKASKKYIALNQLGEKLRKMLT